MMTSNTNPTSSVYAVGSEIRELIDHLDLEANPTDKGAIPSETVENNEKRKGKKRKKSLPDSPSKSKRRKVADRAKDKRTISPLPSTSTAAAGSLIDTPNKNYSSQVKGKLSKSAIYEIKNYSINKWTLKLIRILKDCLARHQWDSAAKILYALTYEPLLTSEVIWKSGYQIFCNHPKSNPDLMMQFAQAICRLDKIFVPGIVLDCIMYFLIDGNCQGAREVMQLKEQFQRKCKIQNPKQQHIANVLHGYEGMLCFIEWKIITQESSDVEAIDSVQKQHIETLANRIITIFEKLFTHPGNWDIFINKYIEVMEYYRRTDQLLNTLKAYSLLNPENPNGCRCLYKLFRKYHPENEKTLHSLLKCLSLSNPSDKLLLEIKNLKYSDNCEFLKIICNLVDFPDTRNDPDVWSELTNLVIELYKNPLREEFAVLNDIWEDRSSWWPQFHFSLDSIEIKDSISAQLYIDKAIVFSLLQAKAGEKYRDTVKKNITDLGLQEVLRKLDWINHFVN